MEFKDLDKMNETEKKYGSELSPEEYFSHIKGIKHTITDEELLKVYDNCLELANKYKITGQKKGLSKLAFHLKCIEKEREIIKMGFNQFIYRDDIEYYIDKVSDNVVKIIELENFEREIPDEVVSIIQQVKDKFDQLYIVFTDYTGEAEREVEKSRRRKDPILFGTFQERATFSVVDRFYYIADWIDEYCDLTLDKMVNETKNVGKRDILRTISTPLTKEDLLDQLDKLTPRVNSGEVDTFILENSSTHNNPKSFSKIKTAFKNLLHRSE